MSDVFTVSIDVEVHDEQELYPAAMYPPAVHNDCMTGVEAEGMLRDFPEDDPDDWEVNVAACLQVLLDPGRSPAGASILQSHVE